MLQPTRMLTERDVERYALSMQWERNIAVNATRAVALLRTRDVEYAAQLRKEMAGASGKITEIRKKWRRPA